MTSIRLFAADMEGTIIEQEMIDEIADHIGKRKEVSAITRAAMEGALDFEAALRERVTLFAGLDTSVLDHLYETRVTLMPGAEALIATLKARGIHCALVTGGFDVFARRVAHRLGFDSWHANRLEIEGGRLTGRVVAPILGRAGKRETLERLAAQLGIGVDQTAAIGDGANDLDMLMASGTGIAFRAKPIVREAMHARSGGIVIEHGDLTALLSLLSFGASV